MPQSPSPPKLFSFPDIPDLSNALADYILKAQKEAIEKRGRFTLAISGGSLPQTLTALIGRKGVKWDKWQIFYADERAVPLDHPDSNHKLAQDTIYAHIPIPSANIHTIDPSLLDDLEELADDYEKALIREFAQRDSARFPIFDLILLGVGPDGHTCSLFPRHALLSEDDRWVAYLDDSPKPPPKRITFTFPVINHAVRVAFVVTGEGKKEILQSVLDRPEEGLPAARVRPVYPGQLVWFTDDAAVAQTKFARKDHLKPWLTKTLEPICDADPEALADYILALLKHNAPESELRKELTSQLEEFLEKEGPPFLDTLFTILRTKSYLPYGTSSPPPATPSHPASHLNPSQPQPIQTLDTGIPIPFDALLGLQNAISGDRGRKRGPDYDDRDGRPPKGPRLSGDGWRGGGWDGRGRGDVMDGGMGGGRGYRPPDQKRGICRDYHNHGYCSRGAYCKYSHGEDAFVPGQMLPMNGQQMQNGMFPPMFPNGGMPFGGMNGATGGSNLPAYDPHEARMDMRPTPGPAMGQRPQRAPILPRENGEGPRTRSGELPVIQDLTPQEAADSEALRAPAPGDGGPAATHGGQMGNGMGPSAPGYGVPAAHPMPAPMDVEMHGPGAMGP
ncbi:hypothetical protein EWM64_g4275, partial [Hericium alpestre]